MEKKMNDFIDDSLLKEVNEVNKKYKDTYKKEVDFRIMPKGITQAKLIKCIELMINDNLSLLVAYNKLYGK